MPRSKQYKNLPQGLSPLGGFSHRFNLVFHEYNERTGQGRKRLGTGRTPNTSPVVLIEVTGTWVHIGAIQVQVVATAVTVRSRRPIVAV